jgi:hypothetical protein
MASVFAHLRKEYPDASVSPCHVESGKAMRLSRILLLAVASITLSIGCETTPRQSEVTNASLTVDITSNPATVANCRRVGSLDGNAVALGCPHLTATRSYSDEECLKYAAADYGADTVLLGANRGVVDIYVCKTAPQASSQNMPSGGQSNETMAKEAPRTAAEAPPMQSTPGTSSNVSPTKVKIVISEAEVRGCIFVDSIDEKIDCPNAYSQGVPCMAYRSSKQGGNTVLANGAGKVYNCPTKPATDGPTNATSNQSANDTPAAVSVSSPPARTPANGAAKDVGTPRIVTELDAVKGCRDLGKVEGHDLLHGDAQGHSASIDNAKRNLIANAKKLQADTILVSHETACVQLGMCTFDTSLNPATTNMTNRPGAANSRNTYMPGEAFSCAAAPTVAPK